MPARIRSRCSSSARGVAAMPAGQLKSGRGHPSAELARVVERLPAAGAESERDE
jgi:hypothetical protein